MPVFIILDTDEEQLALKNTVYKYWPENRSYPFFVKANKQLLKSFIKPLNPLVSVNTDGHGRLKSIVAFFSQTRLHPLSLLVCLTR